jgi:hypothetical protein
MTKIESIMFVDLVPFSIVAEQYIRTSQELKKIFIAGIRQQVLFYSVNQSNKRVIMIRWGYQDIDQYPYETKVHEEEKTMISLKGYMLPIIKIGQFDKLFKGVLNEIELFRDLEGFDELIQYQQDEDLFDMNSRKEILTPPSDFRDIDLKHIFIRACDPKVIEDIIKGDNIAKEDKQTRREKVFIEWLKDKEDLAVCNMKKVEVWAELLKLDHRLFSVKSKNFFRDQKIITFKSGRKS